jgi:hypothetical protein
MENLENLARINLGLDDILVNYLEPLAGIIGYGLDETIDQAEALELSYSMVKALGRELWIYQKRVARRRRGLETVA